VKNDHDSGLVEGVTTQVAVGNGVLKESGGPVPSGPPEDGLR
jgi:hypothetical protein